jgi:hypothetical protein
MRLMMAAATVGLVSLQASSGQTPFTLVGTIDLPGVEGASTILRSTRARSGCTSRHYELPAFPLAVRNRHSFASETAR